LIEYLEKCGRTTPTDNDEERLGSDNYDGPEAAIVFYGCARKFPRLAFECGPSSAYRLASFLLHRYSRDPQKRKLFYWAYLPLRPIHCLFGAARYFSNPL
jgi:hypothetical protein